MTMYTSDSVSGQPSPSDIFKYESDSSYTRELRTFGSGTKADLEIGSSNARANFTAVESGTDGNGTTIAVINQGNGYVKTINAVVDNANGTLSDGTYTNGGVGYASTTGGNGTGATYNVVIASLTPTLVLNVAGSGYVATDTVVVAESTDFSTVAIGNLASTVATIGEDGLTDTTLTISVTYGITATNKVNVVVYPAIDANGAIESTAAQVVTAVNADPVAKLYMLANLENGTGASDIAAIAQSALTGGVAGGIHNAGEVVSTNSVTTLTGQYVVGGSNGTGTIIGILYDAVDTTETEKEGVVVVRGPATVEYDNLTLPATAVEATVKTALSALDIETTI